MNALFARFATIAAPLRCRICWLVAAMTFFAIIVVEAAVLLPSYRNYERDLLLRLEEVGRTAIVSAFSMNGEASPRDLVRTGNSVIEHSPVRGGAIYDAAGQLIGTFGERPIRSLSEIRARGTSNERDADGRRYEVLWPARVTGLPVTVIACLDSSWIGPELTAFVWRIIGLVLLISVFVCSVSMVILSRLILTPMLTLRANLKGAIEDLADADKFSTHERRNDELGDVTNAVNELLRRVSRTYREEVATLAAMANSATDAILAYDADGQIAYTNRSCLELCDFADAESMARAGLPLLRFGVEGAPVSLVESLRDGAYSKEVTLLVGGGQAVPCFVSAARLESEGEGLVRNYAIITDIRELRAAREKLEGQNIELAAADRAKTEFLANVSHELRTPLNAIIGFSELMINETMGPIGTPKYLEYSKDIYDSGQHLLQLISDILDVSKIEAGKAELHEEVVDIGRIVKSSLNLLKERAEEGDISLEARVSQGLPALWADERAMKQVLLNLVSNAVKFTPAGGKVAVDAETQPGGGLVIRVSDSGIGIAPEDIAIALAPFRQVDSKLSRKFDGTGLGLPLAKALTELHNASFDIESEVGLGTTVTLRFPTERIRERAA